MNIQLRDMNGNINMFFFKVKLYLVFNIKITKSHILQNSCLHFFSEEQNDLDENKERETRNKREAQTSLEKEKIIKQVIKDITIVYEK